MDCKRAATSVLFIAGLAAVSLEPARADSADVAFPPFWPLITLRAIVETATAASAAPVRPPFCESCYYGPVPYYCAPPPAACYNSSPAYYQAPPPAYDVPYYPPR